MGILDTALSITQSIAQASASSSRLQWMMQQTDSSNQNGMNNALALTKSATFANRETGIVSDILAATTGLGRLQNMLVAPEISANSLVPVTRSLRLAGTGVSNLSAQNADILSLATSLTGNNAASPMAKIGSGMAASLNNARSALSITTNLVSAISNPATSNLLKNIIPTSMLPAMMASGFSSSIPQAGGSRAHLMVLSTGTGETYYFNLATAPYDTYNRQTKYNIAAQDRLAREQALQAVAKGSDNITLSGFIYTKTGGASQLNRLRAIGYKTEPVTLTTGYGDAMGLWYLTGVTEEGTELFQDGMPRKQKFSLEFQRYGEDYQNL